MVLIRKVCPEGHGTLNMNALQYGHYTLIFWWCKNSLCRFCCFTDVKGNPVDFDALHDTRKYDNTRIEDEADSNDLSF